MTIPKGSSGKISKQVRSGKSGCRTDKMMYTLCSPNVNTGDTYYNYEMHSLTSFYVRGTNNI